MQGDPRQPRVINENIGTPAQEPQGPAPVIGQAHEAIDLLHPGRDRQILRRPADLPGGQRRQGMAGKDRALDAGPANDTSLHWKSG